MTSAAATTVPRSSLAAPFAALLLGAVAMGVSPVFVRLADVGPFTSAFWRVVLALPVLWLWMRIAERGAAGADTPGRTFSLPTVLAGLAFMGDLLCWHLSILKTSIANATFFATTAPVWAVVAGWLLFRTRVAASVLAGLALCIVGGAALVAQSMRADPGHVTGDLLGLGTGMFFGLYFLAVSAARRETGAARVTFAVSLITAAGLFVVALVREHAFLPASIHGWAALVAMAWISHAGGQGLLSVALGLLPTAFSSLVIFLEALAAAGIAWLVLGEAVTPVQAFGGLAILAGIWIARPKPASPPPGAVVPQTP